MTGPRSAQESLNTFYRSYIAGINGYASSAAPSALTRFDAFLAPRITHNDRPLSRDQYHALILPLSVFHIEALTADPEPADADPGEAGDGAVGSPRAPTGTIGARLRIVLADGRVVKEHVFYQVGKDGIERVWSMVEGL